MVIFLATLFAVQSVENGTGFPESRTRFPLKALRQKSPKMRHLKQHAILVEMLNGFHLEIISGSRNLR